MVSKKKNNFRRPRKEIRQYRKHFMVSGLCACLVFLIGLGIWYGARRPEVTIRTISVSGGSTVPHELIENKVQSVLTGTYALLIPRRFAYIFPQKDIIAIVNAIPRVHDASVIRASSNELRVSFEEYTPYALWCDSATIEASSTPTCVFLDEKGFAYAPAPTLIGETLIRLVIEGRIPEQGVQVYNAETLARYAVFSRSISSHHDSHLRAITETKDGDLILHLSSDVNVLMTKDASIQDIFEKIESLFQSDSFKGKQLEEFEYIDLRFGNKVYVKERGADLATSTEGLPGPSVPPQAVEPRPGATTVPSTSR